MAQGGSKCNIEFKMGGGGGGVNKIELWWYVPPKKVQVPSALLKME